MHIHAKFLGKTELFINDKKIDIQQKKLLALFLYLLFNGNSTRDVLANMFWCDHSEEDAKKNLRNSIYKLRKLIAEDIFVSVGYTYIKINPTFKITKDTDIFVMEKNEEKLAELEDFVFLDNFYIKGSIEFEKWLYSIRSIYEKMFSDRLGKALDDSVKVKNVENIEKYAKKLLQIDVYNEKIYRYLMSVYAYRGLYNEALKLYSALEKSLDKDLKIQPDNETAELYEKIIRMRDTKHSNVKSASSYYIKPQQIFILQDEYKKFLENKEFSHYIVKGDLGSGKSKVVETFLANENIKEVVLVEFSVEEKTIPGLSLQRLLEKYLLKTKLADAANIDNTPASHLSVLEKLLNKLYSEKPKSVLHLKNMEYIDEQSLAVMAAKLFACKSLFLVGEYCQNFCSEKTLPDMLESYPNVAFLHLPSLNEEEIFEFINATVSNIDKMPLKDLRELSQGNIMFLQDINDSLKNGGSLDDFKLSNASVLKLKKLLFSLSSDEKEIFNILSVFENGIELSTLSNVLQKSIYEVLHTVGKMSVREIICYEKNQQHDIIKIKYKLLRDYVYTNLENIVKDELHKLAALYAEKKHTENKADYFYILEAKYHYSFTADEYKKLYYCLIDLQYKLYYYDELFPTIKDYEQLPFEAHLNRSSIHKTFADYGKALQLLESTLSSEKFYELKMLYDFLLGRTLSRGGERERAIPYIRELIDYAQKLERKDFLIKGYLETIYYGLKNDNKFIMAEYIQKAKALDLTHFEIVQGMLYRLEGLYFIMDEKYEKAQNVLFKSLEIFNRPKLRLSNHINIAAAYDYLGLVHRNQHEYEKATEYFSKAIAVCLDKNIQKSLDIFYMDLGYTYFLQNQYEKAEEYFIRSIEIYDLFGTYWLRSICESCMSLIYFYRNEKEKALEYFRRAEIYSKKDFTIEERKVLFETKRILSEAKII